MKRAHLTALLILSLILAIRCSDPDFPHAFPLVLTEEVENIDQTGADFSGVVAHLGANQTILSYGFVWDVSPDPTLSSRKVVLQGEIKTGGFTHRISSDLNAGVVYYVRAFIKTETTVVYGKSVEFKSLGGEAPVITDFIPQEGFDGNEVTIRGRNFSTRMNGNQVNLGGLPCIVTSASESEITVRTPVSDRVGGYAFSVAVAGKATVSNSLYSILGPYISSLSKVIGRVGDVITVTGKYFDRGNLSLYFGRQEYWPRGNFSQIRVISPETLECVVPDIPGNIERLHLYTYGETGSKLSIFSDDFAILNSWSQARATTPLTSSTHTTTAHASVVVGNSVYIIGGRSVWQFVPSTNTWIKKADFPGHYRFTATAFKVGGKIYYGFGQGFWEPPLCCNKDELYNDLWAYDIGSDTWSFTMETPLPAKHGLAAMVIGEKAYIAYDAKGAIWEFDPQTVAWRKIETEFTYGGHTITFTIGNKGYLIGGTNVAGEQYSNTSVWEFDPSGPTITRKADCPVVTYYGGIGATKDNHGLVLCNSDGGYRVYEYAPENDTWVRRQSVPPTTHALQMAQYINGKFYLAAGNLLELRFN